MSDLTISGDQAAVNAAALRVAEAQSHDRPNTTDDASGIGGADADVAKAQADLAAAEARLHSDQAAAAASPDPTQVPATAATGGKTTHVVEIVA